MPKIEVPSFDLKTFFEDNFAYDKRAATVKVSKFSCIPFKAEALSGEEMTFTFSHKIETLELERFMKQIIESNSI